MKKSAFLLLMFSICLLPLSCGGDTKTDTSYDEKSYEEEVPNKEDKGTVKFLLDGVAWTNDGQNPHNGLNVDAITDHNTVVQFKAHAANGTYLDITVYNVDGIGPGTYALEKTNQAAYQSETADKLIYLTAGMTENPGTITIESLTESRVKGRFAFKMRSSVDAGDIKVVSEGVFDVEFN